MGRFQVLEREINKGISVDEKSNQVINGWSPNNVRRLIIGYEFAVVQYFVTGGKYQRLIEIIDFRRVAEKDLQQVATDPQKYKPILHVLTQGRICSSIEEVIFCSQGYPPQLLALDTNTTKLAPSNTTLENRFVRLRHISITPQEVKAITVLANETKKSDQLLLTILTDKNVPTKSLLEQHQDDWWKGVSLRPKYYAMDLNTLPDYFDKVKQTFEVQKREYKLDELSKKKDEEAIKKYLPTTSAVISYIDTIFNQSQEIFKSAPIVSKAEWANVLQYENMCKGINKELSKNEVAIQSYRRINFDRLIQRGTEFNLSQQEIKNLQAFQTIIFEHVLKDEDAYKRESNKSDLPTSLQTLQKLAGTIFNLQVNIVFLSFAKYLTRNTPKYANFFYSQLKTQPQTIQYTRTIMEYCNKHIDEGWAKQAMDTIQATEVLVEQYTLPTKYKDTKQILASLAGVK